ncbi:MAG: HAD family phosphatase [Chloroflexi bacterium]|nr:HAD family phosphatase [Chloroflexota bacterium]
MINAVLFDMDGVLIESFEAWASLVDDAARHFGHPSVTREAFRAVYGKPTQSDVDLFFPDQTVGTVEAYYEAHFAEHAAAAEVMPGAVEVLAALERQGVPTAVVTNTPSGLARQMLESASLAPNAVVGGSDVPDAKPAPDMIFRACELLGVEPWDALVVGDSPYDKQAAAAAGAPFAGIGGIEGNFTLSGLHQVLDIVEGTFE